jgi:hypothetical protein
MVELEWIRDTVKDMTGHLALASEYRDSFLALCVDMGLEVDCDDGDIATGWVMVRLVKDLVADNAPMTIDQRLDILDALYKFSISKGD